MKAGRVELYRVRGLAAEYMTVDKVNGQIIVRIYRPA